MKFARWGFILIRRLGFYIAKIVRDNRANEPKHSLKKPKEYDIKRAQIPKDSYLSIFRTGNCKSVSLMLNLVPRVSHRGRKRNGSKNHIDFFFDAFSHIACVFLNWFFLHGRFATNLTTACTRWNGFLSTQIVPSSARESCAKCNWFPALTTRMLSGQRFRQLLAWFYQLIIIIF